MPAIAVSSTVATVIVPNTGGEGRAIVFNGGPNPIHIDTVTTVSTTTSVPIQPSATLLTEVAAGAIIYARAATADQVAPADTRVMFMAMDVG